MKIDPADLAALRKLRSDAPNTWRACSQYYDIAARLGCPPGAEDDARAEFLDRALETDIERGLLSALPDPEPVRCVHCGMRCDEAREMERDAYFCPHSTISQRHEFSDGSFVHTFCVFCGISQSESRAGAPYCPGTTKVHQFIPGATPDTQEEPDKSTGLDSVVDPIARYLGILQPQNEALVEPQQPVMMAIAVGILLGVRQLEGIHKALSYRVPLPLRSPASLDTEPQNPVGSLGTKETASPVPGLPGLGIIRTAMRFLFPLILLLAVPLLAQQSTPDCQWTDTFTAVVAGPAHANKSTTTGGTPCTYWVFSYWTNGAASVSIKMEGSADAAGVSSGSYTALTAAQGTSNPATGTTQGDAILCCDYYPWIRMNPTTFSGSSQTMIVRVYGWRAQPVNPNGSSGPTSSVNVAQWGGVATTLGQKLMASSVPVVLASDESTLSSNLAQMAGSSMYPCLSRAVFNLSASGDTEIIAASAATTIRICHLSFATVAPEDVKVVRGTGTNCGTSPADVTGLYKSIQAAAFDWGPFSPLTGAASGAICLNQSVMQALGGVVVYDQR